MPSRKFFILFLSLILSLAAFSVLWADTGDAYHGSNFLKVKPGARANGMGPAYLGISDDLSTVFWNPAGAVTILDSSMQMGLGLMNYNTYLGHFALNINSTDFCIGTGIMLYQYDDIVTYDAAGNPGDELKNYQGYGLFNFSFFLTDFSSMGFTAKAGTRKLEDNTIYTLSGGLGLMVEYLLQFVLVVDDIGYSWDKLTDQYQFINPELSFGVAYFSKNNRGRKVLGASFTASRGLDLGEAETRLGLGGFIEVWHSDTEIEDYFSKKKSKPSAFFLNLGFQNYHGVSFSGGFTLVLFEIKMDYAISFPTKYNEDFSHYATLEFSF